MKPNANKNKQLEPIYGISLIKKAEKVIWQDMQVREYNLITYYPFLKRLINKPLSKLDLKYKAIK